MGATIAQRDATLVDLMFSKNTIREVKLRSGITRINLTKFSTQRQHLILQYRNEHRWSMIGHRLAITFLASVLPCLSFLCFFGSTHPSVNRIVLHNERVTLRQHHICHLQMLLLSYHSLLAIQFLSLLFQGSISLDVFILLPNQTYTAFYCAVRIVVIRIVGPATPVKLTVYKVKVMLNIVALVSKFIEVDALQRGCGNRRWSNVNANIAFAQSASLLWLLATYGKLQIIFISASNAPPDDNQLAKTVYASFEGFCCIPFLFTTKIDWKVD
ncbi:MAG: hypothetical protein SPL58_04145 [Bacteroidaceae bacterium]|nr:hypothetical protein [Bacteroidaceae bacterium]